MFPKLRDFRDTMYMNDAPTDTRWTSERTLRFAWSAPVRPKTEAFRALPHVLDAVPGINTLTLIVDSLCVDRDALVKDAHAALKSVDTESPTPTRTVEIPFCTDEDLAPDLHRIAEHTGLTLDVVLDRFTRATFRVALFGFAPGFAYLDGLPEELRTPRLDTPRTRVPAGSVAIAGEHAAVYPCASPGGWNLIGRTPLRMFDAQRDPPALLRTGDAVRFVLIDRAAFDAGCTP